MGPMGVGGSEERRLVQARGKAAAGQQHTGLTCTHLLLLSLVG